MPLNSHNDLLLPRIKTWFEILALLAAVIGGCLAFAEYKSKLKSDKIKATLEFLQRYNSGHIATSRKKLLSAWLKHGSNTHEAAVSDAAWDELLSKVLKGGCITTEIFDLIYFYEEVELCIDQAICDPESAIAYFANDAHIFFNGHFPEIDKARKNFINEELGNRLEDLISRLDAPPAYSNTTEYGVTKTTFCFFCTL